MAKPIGKMYLMTSVHAASRNRKWAKNGIIQPGVRPDRSTPSSEALPRIAGQLSNRQPMRTCTEARLVRTGETSGSRFAECSIFSAREHWIAVVDLVHAGA